MRLHDLALSGFILTIAASNAAGQGMTGQPAPRGFLIQSIMLVPESNSGSDAATYNATVSVAVVQPIPGIPFFQPISIQIPHIQSLEGIKDKVKPEVDKIVEGIIKRLQEDKAAFDHYDHR